MQGPRFLHYLPLELEHSPLDDKPWLEDKLRVTNKH